MENITYEIVKTLAVLSTSKKNWTKELNVISWNGRAPKLDLRDWAPNHEKMGKGVTLEHEEAVNLYYALGKYVYGDQPPVDDIPVEEPVESEEPAPTESVDDDDDARSEAETEELKLDELPDSVRKMIEDARKAMGTK